MANKTEVNQVIKGMVTDLHPMKMQPGMYFFALNADSEGFDGNGFPQLSNSASNILSVQFPAGYKVVWNIHVVEQNRIIWFLCNPETGQSQLGESYYFEDCRTFANDRTFKGSCDDCSAVIISENLPLEKVTQTACATYEVLATDECLEFCNQITTAQYVLLPCGLRIYFNDPVNGRRYLEFDYVNGDPTQGLVIQDRFYTIIGYNESPCETPIYSDELDCNKLLVQPVVGIPCIEFIDLVAGGSNRAGVYQFFIAFADEAGNKRSSYFSSTNPISIFTKQLTVATDYVTDKAIKLQINNLDAFGPFQYYNLVVLETTGNSGSSTPLLVGTFPVTQTSVTYTGNDDTLIRLTIGDIFQRLPFYKSAGTSAISNGIMYEANLEEYPDINIQRIANNVILGWQTIAIPEPVYRNPRNSNKFRSLMRDEVYPFGLVLIINNTFETAVGHIPGREAEPEDLEVIDNDDVIQDVNCSPNPRNLRWQVYNTATLEGGDLQVYDECAETCYQYGRFAYWESTERYPNKPEVWGDLCGQFIRHPKMPDSTITHIHDYEGGGAEFSDNNIVYPLGVRVDVDSVRAAIATAVAEGAITQAQADTITGFRIVRGNRFNNKSVIAKGLLFDVNQYTRKDEGVPIDTQPTYFANYPYNDLRPNPFITDEITNYDNHNDPEGPDLPFTFSNRLTFHSPDTHFNEPTVGTELKLETVEFGEAEGYFIKSRKQAKQKLLSDAAYYTALAAGVVNYFIKIQPETAHEYKVIADYRTTQTSDGTMYIGTGGAAVNSFTSGTGTINTQISASSQNLSLGTRTEDHNNDASPTISPATGAPSLTNGIVDPPTAEHMGRVVQGAKFQYMNILAGPSLYIEKFGTVLGAALYGIAATTWILNLAGTVASEILAEMNIVLDLIKALVPMRDWTVQYHSVGKYNNYVAVPGNGFKRREILASAYLKPENNNVAEELTLVDTVPTVKVNNWNRESSLYLKYGGTPFDNPSGYTGVYDNSRQALDSDLFACNLNQRKYTDIVSYYASIKNYVPDQYGSIYNVEYIPTDSCPFDIDASGSTCRGVYGGDTFINRFALKVKVPYFLADTFELPNGTDFNFSEYPNLAFPRHYYNNTNTLGSELAELDGNIFDIITDLFSDTPSLLGRPKSIRDCATNPWFYQNGYIYLYHYGLPYFLVESDVNVDLRHAENTREGDFYPRQTDLEEWLQQDVVPISEDNTYFYNRNYSKQNKEAPLVINGPLYEPGRACKTTFPNRIIYSVDPNFLVYRANDLYNFPLSKGRIVSIDAIENDGVLVRTENSTSVFKSILRTQVDGQTVQIGNGGVFSNPPQEFAETTLGYAGTQHKAILHTEFGHVWADAKRGLVINLANGGNGLDEISKNGKRNWFKENLPFRVLRDFKNFPEDGVDDNFNGLGLAMVFDKRFSRMFLSKLDYKKKPGSLVLYDDGTGDFYVGEGSGRTVVDLGDPQYFDNVSWTISYNFLDQSWTSYHSFIPNYYLGFVDYFASGESSGMWLHNMTNASFQVYYGKLYPFIVEDMSKFEAQDKQLVSLTIDAQVMRYENEMDYFLKKYTLPYNKLIVSNDLYNSGLMNLVAHDEEDLSSSDSYPIKGLDSWTIPASLTEFKWQINDLYNLIRTKADVPLWYYDVNNVDKHLNQSAFSYQQDEWDMARLRGQWFRNRYINDNLSNYKIIHKFALSTENPIIR